MVDRYCGVNCITVKLSLLNQHRRVHVKKLQVRRLLVCFTVTVNVAVTASATPHLTLLWC